VIYACLRGLLDCYNSASGKNDLMRFNFYPGDRPHPKEFDDDEIAEFKIGKIAKYLTMTTYFLISLRVGAV
jgi:hypothetical protein